MTDARRNRIAAEAVGRFARARGAGPPADESELKAWLAADIAHAEAYSDLDRLWTGLEDIRAAPLMLGVREEALRAVRRRRWRRVAVSATAACLLLAVGLTVASAFLLSFQMRQAGAERPAIYATGVGQLNTVTLSDGSSVTLDTDSMLEVSLDRRRRSVQLLKGRALFRVAKDPTRPFVVSVGDKAVEALGTEFEVYARPASLEVTLIEGRVKVQQQSSPHVAEVAAVELAAGQKLVAASAGWGVSDIQPDTELSWLKRTLVFDEAPLSEVVAELNRYSSRTITLATKDLGEKRLSGVFRSDDPANFLSSVETLQLARVQVTAEGYRLGKF